MLCNIQTGETHVGFEFYTQKRSTVMCESNPNRGTGVPSCVTEVFEWTSSGASAVSDSISDFATLTWGQDTNMVFKVDIN